MSPMASSRLTEVVCGCLAALASARPSTSPCLGANRHPSPEMALRSVDADSLEAFVVPGRFDTATFATYRPDPDFPSQRQALERLQTSIVELNRASAPRGLLGRLRRSDEAGWKA